MLALSPAAAAAAAASGQLVNVASVTLEANCTNSAAVPATLEELQSIVDNNLLAVNLPNHRLCSKHEEVEDI